MDTQGSIQNTETQERIVKSQAQRQKEYRQRKKEKERLQNPDLEKEIILKSQVQRQEEYRQRREDEERIQCTDLEKGLILKSEAQRKKEYRQRKKEIDRIQNPGLEKERIVKSQAQRKKEYRQRKKEIERIQNPGLEKERIVKSQAQRQKEYRQRKKEKERIQNPGLKKERLVSIVKSQAQRQKEYRQRKKETERIQYTYLEKERIRNVQLKKEYLQRKREKKGVENTDLEKERKRKLHAQRQKEYRERKKLEKVENPCETEKSNAQYQEKISEEEKIKLIIVSETLNSNIDRKNVNTERDKTCSENEEKSNKSMLINNSKPGIHMTVAGLAQGQLSETLDSNLTREKVDGERDKTCRENEEKSDKSMVINNNNPGIHMAVAGLAEGQLTISETLDSNLAREKVNAERYKTYRENKEKSNKSKLINNNKPGIDIPVAELTEDSLPRISETLDSNLARVKDERDKTCEEKSNKKRVLHSKMEAPKCKENSGSNSSKGGGKKGRVYINQNKQKNGQKPPKTKKVILNLIKPAEVEIPLTTGFDYRSQMGQFGWASINNIHIPYIFRTESTKYVALRIINQVLFPTILSAFHQELFDLFPLRCYTMTDTEKSLYNEINFIHTNGAYGLNSFQTGVQLVLLDDAIRLYNFLSHLHSKMFTFKPDHHSEFGYKTFISPTHKVPFVKSNGIICYPMLYFEAEKGFLMQHSTTVDDFSTKILMVLMSIQSVHCSIDNFRVITQNVITKYFDPKHNVEDTWPIQMKPVFCNHSRSNDSNLKFTNADNPEEMAVALREMTHIRGMSYLKYFPGYERVAVVLKDNEKEQTVSNNNVDNNVIVG